MDNPSRRLAKEILAQTGPGRFLVCGTEWPGLPDALLDFGCDAILDGACTYENFVPDTILLGNDRIAAAGDLVALLTAQRGQSRAAVVALPPPPEGNTTQSNESVILAALSAGFRRHPGAFSVGDFERSNLSSALVPLCFELIPDHVLERWPLKRLRAERDLHMDMTRESGARADAHLVRYALAAEWIRPGDAVLDCACGLGYGTAVLAARSQGDSFVGIDIDSGSIDYAKDNFSQWSGSYLAGSATRLDGIADRSIDTLVSFETLEHLEDYTSFLAEAARVLKPGGHIIVSVPNRWADESGRDPNPHHHHVFDFERCRFALERHFRVEARYSQSAPGGTKMLDARRELRIQPLPARPDESDTEWWIVVATVPGPAVTKDLAAESGTDDPPASNGEPVDNIAECLDVGSRALAAGREDDALRAFRRGVRLAVEVLRDGTVGSNGLPTAADFSALRETLGLGEQCAIAIDAARYFRRSPGLYWRLLHARDLQSRDKLRAAVVRAEQLSSSTVSQAVEIARLNAEFERLRKAATLRTLLSLRIRELFLILLPRLIARLLGRKS